MVEDLSLGVMTATALLAEGRKYEVGWSSQTEGHKTNDLEHEFDLRGHWEPSLDCKDIVDLYKTILQELLLLLWVFILLVIFSPS